MLEAIVIGIGSGVVAGLIAWGGLKVELHYLRRDIDRAQASADLAHRRLDRMQQRG